MPADQTSSDSLASRIVRVVEGVVDAGGPVGPRGLARTLGMDRSTVGRILQQLEGLSVLDRVEDGYLPGPRLFTMGRVLAAIDTLPNVIGPVLGGLVEQFDETCYICAFGGDTAVFTHEIQSSKPLRLVVELGKPVPLHAGAAGRAILAGLDRDTAAELLGPGPLPQITPHTITDVDRLLALAEEDRRRGYTATVEERIPDSTAVAAPFFARGGVCQGSVVFTSPMTRLDRDRIPEIGRAVHAAAAKISARLGHVERSSDD